MRKNDLIYESLVDLLQDCQIFDFLIRDYQNKLKTAQSSTIVVLLRDDLRQLKDENLALGNEIKKITDEQSLCSCIGKKRSLFSRLHELAGLVGSAVVMTHWQSPASEQVIVDNVGSLKGKIKATINDYTRDQHVLGNAFEEIYRKQLIPIRRTIPLFAYAVSSGMAAMTTAALFVLGETQKESCILLGKSCYFETKQLVRKMFGDRIKEIDVSSMSELSESIRLHAPSAIFIDLIGNEPEMTVINVQSVIACIKNISRQHIHLVVDISARTSLKLLISSFIMPKNVSIIGVESLNKLLQFGLDRVTAGVVWGTGFKAMKLYDYRDHAGTNCPDSTIATLPTPNKKFVSLYMKRIIRNNASLGNRLNGNNKRGPFIILTLKNNTKRNLNNFVSRVLRIAKKRSIPLVFGTSFGLATTRVYVIAMHTQYEKPFLRICAGTETAWEIDRLIRSVMLRLDQVATRVSREPRRK